MKSAIQHTPPKARRRRLRLLITSLLANRDGAAAVLLATALPPIVCAAAVAVDLGTLYLAERRLQGVADAAAMAAANGDIVTDGNRRALALIDKSRISAVSIVELVPGIYRAEKEIALADRFVETDDQPTAARVLLEQRVPLFFAKVLTGENTTTVRAKSTAQRVEMAAYSLGSKLVDFSGGIGNTMLSALAGSQLNLSVLDTEGLATTSIDVLGFADALKAAVGNEGETYGELFGRDVPISDVIEALAASSASADTAETLRQIALDTADRSVVLSDLIDLGPYARATTNDGSAGVQVDAYSMLRSVLEASLGESYTVQFGIAVPGVAKTMVTLVGGSSMRTSPWLTITRARNYVLRTSQSRMMLDVEATGGGLAKVSLPIFIELAEAEARLSDIDCNNDPDHDGVTLQVTPSVGTVAIGDVDRTLLPDLATELEVVPATLVKLPLASVTGYSEVDLGGASPQPVRFTLDEIEQKTTKTVGTDDVFAAVATSLLDSVDIKARVLGLGINGSTLAGAVGQALSLIAPALDAAIFETTQAAGLKVGAADVRVEMARCGISTTVA